MISVSSGGENQYIVFKLSKNNYGINIKFIREVVEPKNITKIPKAPYYIEGIMNLRGKLVSLINLARLLETEMEQFTGRKSKVLIIDSNIEKQNNMEIGLIVDQVLGVLRLNSSELEQSKVPSEIIDKVIEHHGQLILVLNMDKLIKMIDFAHTGVE